MNLQSHGEKFSVKSFNEFRIGIRLVGKFSQKLFVKNFQTKNSMQFQKVY